MTQDAPPAVASRPADSHKVGLRIHAAVQDHDYLLKGVLRPLLSECKAEGSLVGAYFMRRDVATPPGISVSLALTEQLSSSSIIRRLTTALESAARSSGFEVEESADSELADLDNLFVGPTARAFAEEFFFEQCDFLLDALTQCVDDQVRAQIGFDIMTAHVWAVSRALYPRSTASYPVCFASYRSHADGFFVMSKTPEATRADFERRYRQNATPLMRRVSSLLAQFTGDGPIISPSANLWRHGITKWCEQALSKIIDGELAFATSEESQGRYLGDQYDLSVSPFQKEIQNNSKYRAFMCTDPQFLAVRVMMSFLYWSLQQLGIRLVKRYLLCHCVSRCFEELFEIDLCASVRAYSSL